MSARISAVVFGLPPRARDRHLQMSRPARCQLTQGKNLDCQVTPAAEEDSDGGQEGKDELDHEHHVLTRVTPPTEID
jgi:hypothetical protein